MMSGNPNWWSMNGMHPQISPSQFVYGSSVLTNSSNPSSDDNNNNHPNQDFPLRSWSQLLRGGLSGGEEEEERVGGNSLFQQQKKLENWEDQLLLNLNPNPSFTTTRLLHDHHVKQEISTTTQSNTSQLFGPNIDHQDEQFQAINKPPSNCWINNNSPTNSHHHQVMPVSSPTSCITTNLSNNNFLNFSATEGKSSNYHHQDHTSECNSTVTGGVSKKARVHQSTAQPALKVRKEKLGDRITALHQLVSPFGKTDTASVLSEAIGYIRFLQGQIEALSSPYMRNASGSTGNNHQHSVQERSACLFTQEPSQFLNHDIGMDGRGASKQDSQGRVISKELRSRGLCLVPIACTQHMGSNDNGADYWAPAALGGGF